MQFSKYQLDVFNFAANETGHAAIESVAGSGKTTTGVELVQQFPKHLQGRFSSFTKVIVEELTNRLRTLKLNNVTARTYNSFGAGILYRDGRGGKLLTEYAGQKTDQILQHNVFKGLGANPEDNASYGKCKNQIIRMISLFKNLAIFTLEQAEEQFDQIVEYYDIELPKDSRFKELCLETWAYSLKRHDILDYDDQKHLPLLLNLQIPQTDFLVIDEYQDSCPIESMLMLRSCERGRIMVFGDRFQAIYSFKGTTPNSMQTFIDTHQAKMLPLSICYRCSKAAIREAQKIVPHIEWGPNAIEGTTDTIHKTEFQRRCTDRDLVLARTTEDLVKSVMNFVAEGRGAYIEGREYGTQLKYFLTKFSGNEGDYCPTELLMDRMWSHFHEMHPELMKRNRETAALSLETKCETLDVIAIGTNTAREIQSKIDKIFTDRGNGIRHMTIHKSKGLEGNKDAAVHILRPDKLPHPRAKKEHLKEEELRLKYVGITRTKKDLFWVLKDKDEK